MVTSGVVPALNLSRHRSTGTATPRRPAPRPIALPTLPPHAGRDALYGLAVLDRYGRVADRAMLRALAWGPGQTLTLTLIAGSVLVLSHPEGSVRVGNDEHLRLPVGVRRAYRLVAGDRILLVADPSAGRLLLHPPAALDVLLDAHHAALLQGATS
ncbi:AbrB/MazE/SpoVT family DNA-binding domain-containing protein [Pseudonocardia sp. GCM10023141]|uniref:AbrB/MazE/SpoVT family DNA-binding domain-containing protein n=1 Tax=Pseudonocardia sp. GCM10023141 TaxID=3252653 RepID=UPI0036215F52